MNYEKSRVTCILQKFLTSEKKFVLILYGRSFTSNLGLIISEIDHTCFFQMPSSEHLGAKTLKNLIFYRFPQYRSSMNQGVYIFMSTYCTVICFNTQIENWTSAATTLADP